MDPWTAEMSEETTTYNITIAQALCMGDNTVHIFRNMHGDFELTFKIKSTRITAKYNSASGVGAPEAVQAKTTESVPVKAPEQAVDLFPPSFFSGKDHTLKVKHRMSKIANTIASHDMITSRRLQDMLGYGKGTTYNTINTLKSIYDLIDISIEENDTGIKTAHYSIKKDKIKELDKSLKATEAKTTGSNTKFYPDQFTQKNYTQATKKLLADIANYIQSQGNTSNKELRQAFNLNANEITHILHELRHTSKLLYTFKDEFHATHYGIKNEW